MARQAALRKVESLPQTSEWKGVAATLLSDSSDSFCATVAEASPELATSMLDMPVQRRLRAAEADRRVAEKETEARLARVEADRKEAEVRLARVEADRRVAEKEAEVRLARAGQQDAPGAVAGPSAGGAVTTAATTDAARRDQDKGKKLLAEWVHWIMGGKEKTL
ncbi:hypothetical protein HYH02_007763 [Chlamydomonas schloesseri]|uniref:Uncharacterized protein n=1 Tax=Chlamydomonas schloesseri TaxID=2026947 RepID=A0A835WHH7_9CHLO|nr:hypothetical protein HYH02_007762 [Chlamydomonas schloesseri]KAG2447438.1 hypothetical protein HYH02_007763 [Chlamydomonas schloesseri]|eukprot:KAG2447437.1 hypothetical protein HYH02_007762 [Chlamydomonas schloesseri]